MDKLDELIAEASDTSGQSSLYMDGLVQRLVVVLKQVETINKEEAKIILDWYDGYALECLTDSESPEQISLAFRLAEFQGEDKELIVYLKKTILGIGDPRTEAACWMHEPGGVGRVPDHLIPYVAEFRQAWLLRLFEDRTKKYLLRMVSDEMLDEIIIEARRLVEELRWEEKIPHDVSLDDLVVDDENYKQLGYLKFYVSGKLQEWLLGVNEWQ